MDYAESARELGYEGPDEYLIQIGMRIELGALAWFNDPSECIKNDCESEDETIRRYAEAGSEEWKYENSCK